MEVKELESFYINEENHTLDVTFRLISDGDDISRTDQIDLNETESFGLNINFDDSYPDDDEDYLDRMIRNYESDLELDEDEIISFLNEYYLVYPKKLPKPELY